MDENDFTDAFTGDFINEEPIVFKGLTDGEVKLVFFMAFVIGTPVGISVALLIGIPMLAIVFMVIVPMFAVWIIAGLVERARRGKPAGYVEQKVHIYLVKHGLATPRFTCESYRWGLGRLIRRKG